MTKKVHFGTGIFHSKYFGTQNSSTGQGYRTAPNATILYTGFRPCGLISGRNGYVEPFPYGIEIEPEALGRNALFNSNGCELHPLMVLTSTKTAPVFEKYLAGGSAGSTRLNIYKGTKPTTTENMTSLDTYASNLLISFIIPGGMSGIKFTKYDMFNAPTLVIKREFPHVGEVEAVLGICPTPTEATGAGLATWFWFGNYATPSDISDTAFVIGDIGAIDDGLVDMHLTDPYIISGDKYKSFGFKFRIPMSHTI
jgi:hypothetical protein